MSHRNVKKSLPDYLEGELPLEERARVDAHLEGCEECAREVAEIQQTIRLLRTMPEPEPPPMIAANVMRRIRAGETRPGFFSRIGRTLGAVLEPGFVLPASAVAVAALVVVVLQGPEGIGGLGLGEGAASAPAEIAGAAASFGAIAPPGSAVEYDPSTRSYAAATNDRRFVRDGRASAWTAGASERRSSAGSGWRIEIERSSPPARSGYPNFSLTPRSTAVRGPMLVADHFEANGTARQVAQPRAMGAAESPFVPHSLLRDPGSGGSGGEDPRDVWLARAFSDPVTFSRYIGDRSLAEQELWVSRLADRAESRGLLEDLVEALRASGDGTARWLADDFSAASAERALEHGGPEGPAFEELSAPVSPSDW